MHCPLLRRVAGLVCFIAAAGLLLGLPRRVPYPRLLSGASGALFEARPAGDASARVPRPGLVRLNRSVYVQRVPPPTPAAAAPAFVGAEADLRL